MGIITTCFVFLGDDNTSSDNRSHARQISEHSLLFSKVLCENQERFLKAPCRKGKRLICVNHVTQMIHDDMFIRREASPVSFKILHTFKQLRSRLSDRTSIEGMVECEKNVTALTDKQYLIVMSCGETGDLIGGVICQDTSPSFGRRVHPFPGGKGGDTETAEAKVHNKHRMEGWSRWSTRKIVPFGEMQTEPTSCTYCGDYCMVLEPCAYCQKTLYCSGMCQHLHWVKTHKKQCKRSCLTNITIEFTT